MFNNLFNFPNKKERDDFIYAIIVIFFFAILFWKLLYKENKIPFAQLEPTKISADYEKLAISSATADIDSDNDGVLDTEDICPIIAGIKEYGGCPRIDMDSDGIVNLEDSCPRIKGIKEKHGCPAKFSRPDLAASGLATASLVGSKPEVVEMAVDSDNDGVNDEDDKCPNEAGSVSNDGCPEVKVDSDGDGVVDELDRCPNEAGLVKNDGCPEVKEVVTENITEEEEEADSDGDGVVDSEDSCPNEVGPKDNKGCPRVELKKEESEAVEEAIRSIQFYYNSSRIRSSSLKNLNKILSILNNYPTYKLDIIGHTDNKGGDQDNIILSNSRAKACYNFFIKKGISKDRLSFTGKGEGDPIASNDTVEGRNQNRRVEFFLKK